MFGVFAAGFGCTPCYSWLTFAATHPAWVCIQCCSAIVLACLGGLSQLSPSLLGIWVLPWLPPASADVLPQICGTLLVSCPLSCSMAAEGSLATQGSFASCRCQYLSWCNFPAIGYFILWGCRVAFSVLGVTTLSLGMHSYLLPSMSILLLQWALFFLFPLVIAMLPCGEELWSYHP